MKHLKLAVFTGLITGILIGLIDSISRLIAVKFEWFEFYQTLFLSTVVMLIIFIILGILVEIASRKFRVTKKGSSLFYFASANAFLVIFYAGTITHFFFTKISSPSLRNLGIIALILFAAALIFVSILTIFKKCVSRFFLRCKKRNIPQLIHNIFFAIAVFVVVSFAMDLYFINSEPGFTPTGLDAPNVILISLDTVRADHLSMYNYSRDTTPNLARFAEKSIVFDNAISSSSWTLSGQASLITGKYPFNHNANNLHHKIDKEQTTLAELLRDKGYNTAGFQAGHFTKAKFGFGQGFNLYKDRTDFYDYITSFSKLDIITALSLVLPIHKLLGSDGELTAEEMNNMIIPWLRSNKDYPFFLFAVYFDAHDPYNLGDYTRFSNRTIDVDKTNKIITAQRYSEVSETEVQDLISLYDTELYYLDKHLGDLFDELERLEIMDNSIIIITSDHGEEFYEHGGFGHLQTLYEEVINVPLIIKYPNQTAPRHIKTRVENMNIFPTVLDLIGEAVPEDIDSISLLPLIENSIFGRNYAYAELYGRKKYDELTIKAITIDDMKLITVEPEDDAVPSSLFDLSEDPEEQNNLYGKENKEELENKISYLLPK